MLNAWVQHSALSVLHINIKIEVFEVQFDKRLCERQIPLLFPFRGKFKLSVLSFKVKFFLSFKLTDCSGCYDCFYSFGSCLSHWPCRHRGAMWGMHQAGKGTNSCTLLLSLGEAITSTWSSQADHWRGKVIVLSPW